ncbi:hypothetical protein F6Y05_34545 [Bacillus megaterium]|nr:hypothetical protein [Priestia megaterium]
MEQGVVNTVKERPRITSIQQISTRKKSISISATFEIEKPKKKDEEVELQMDLFSFG